MSRRPVFRFRLFIAADTLNSVQAASNLNALCKAHLPGRHEIEVIDVFKDPKRALAEGIRMTPTLREARAGTGEKNSRHSRRMSIASWKLWDSTPTRHERRIPTARRRCR